MFSRLLEMLTKIGTNTQTKFGYPINTKLLILEVSVWIDKKNKALDQEKV